MIRRSGLDSRGAIPPQWDTGRRWSQSRQAPSHSVRAVRGLVSPAPHGIYPLGGRRSRAPTSEPCDGG